VNVIRAYNLWRCDFAWSRHISSNSDEVQAFAKGIHKILEKKDHSFSMFETRKIDEMHLNNLRLGHFTSHDEMQIVALKHNEEDPTDAKRQSAKDILRHGRRSSRLANKRTQIEMVPISKLKILPRENGFSLVSTYSGIMEEMFDGDLHTDMWLAATTDRA
jgi:hypothetical protein